MMKLIIALIIIHASGKAVSGESWKHSLENPKLQISKINSKALVATENQVSCEHLDFRYTQTKALMEDLQWLITDMMQSPDYVSVYEYISNRTSLDIRKIASLQQFEVVYKIPAGEVQAGFDAIGVLKATDFEQLTNRNPSRESSKFMIRDDGSLELTTTVNAFDICQKGSVDVLFLGTCPAELTNELPCSDMGLCTDGYVADWQECEKISSVRVHLSSLKQEVGKRIVSIKKEW